MANRLDQIARDLLVRTGVAPGASLSLARRDESGGWRIEHGCAGVLERGGRATVRLETPFDLASLTKPVFACTLARLAEQGALPLETPLGKLLPEARSTPSEAASLEVLLAHRAGLEAHRTLFAPLLAGRPFERSSALLEACRARRPECSGKIPQTGFAPVYSDLGYLLAGEAVTRMHGEPLERIIAREVLEPLALEIGSALSFLSRSIRFSTEVAATEVVPWRGGTLRGVVHDENSWALAGHGVSGHAGLFGNARSVARFGCALLDALAGRDRSFLSRESIRRLVSRRPGGSLRAGFDGVSPPASAAGSRMGPETFGHLGFTGTSLWCDPDADVVTVILTNRVNPSRDHLAIRAARPIVQEALTGA